MSAPGVSVVIPTRDRLTYLRDAVASVRGQTLADWELIVVDDASSDGTREWLAEQADPRLRVIELDDHLERSAARNVGLRSSRADDVLFLDDDDRLIPAALECLGKELSGHPEAVAAVGGFVRFDPSGPIKAGAHVRRRVVRDVWSDVLVGWVGTTGRSLLRRRVLEGIGGFDESITFGEDWEMWLRLSAEGPVVLVPQAVLEYRVHGAQVSDPDWAAHRSRHVERYFESVPTDRRSLGEGAVRAWEHHVDGLLALSAGDPRAAVASFVRALRTDASLYTSPLQRRTMRDPLVKSILTAPLGRRGARALRRLLERAR